MDKNLFGWGSAHLPAGGKDTWASSKGDDPEPSLLLVARPGPLAVLVGDVRRGQLGWPSSHLTCPQMPRASGWLLKLLSLLTEARH